MNTNKYSLESRREQANKYKTWGIVLVVIGFGLFLYGGAKMVFGPQVTASLGSEAWQRQFDAAYNYQQSMDGIISVLAVSGIIIAGIGDVLWKKYKTISAGLYGEELVSYTLNSLQQNIHLTIIFHLKKMVNAQKSTHLLYQSMESF